MPPPRPLPFVGDFSSPEEYVQTLLHFVRTKDIFQILCGGVHILDFFTSEPGLFHAALPQEWHEFLLSQDIMRLLDLFMRDDLDKLDFEDGKRPPETLIQYIKSVRDLSMERQFHTQAAKLPILPRSVSVGMKPKKIHEVASFASFLTRLSDDIQSSSSSSSGDEGDAGVTHFVDFGSGQNYLGRALASEPYNRRVVAVEGRENNVAGARVLDRLSGLAVKQKVMRNKKLWNQILEARGEGKEDDPEALAAAVKQVAGAEAFDFRPMDQLGWTYSVDEGKGQVQYVSGKLDSGDLAEVIAKIDSGTGTDQAEEERQRKLKLMAISIHSCGNLSHFGIRSLVLNPSIRAVAIVGCCYNLLTERLGPPTYKHTYLRPSLQALNGRVFSESDRRDPQGFPMSERFATTRAGAGERGDGKDGDAGVRLNITARMMACQAPQNWSREDSEGFFTRHFFRAVLQKIFLDRGVVSRIYHDQASRDAASGGDETAEVHRGPFDCSTNPVTIGSLRKSCYGSLQSYVRGAIEKLTTSSDYKQYADVMREKMANITDEEIDAYEAAYLPRRKELCVIWSLMAFSATVVEALIVADRWTYLKEQTDIVEDAWVEAVFDYTESPRNLVVVGIKKEGA
ncbi:RNA small subunit methyltransferase [Purpureocillium lavendulum]|uniref:RNA small subunit methyltransferase n=1 Tax=Purpureocillium lavendulum TaxID=1247861 RepID=A0AB34FIX3_9HYPO|nr:RNA small subunit methyltransferase [Purpureocillium lavendulum]